jgi:rRNA maturation endonuclease Nob1
MAAAASAAALVNNTAEPMNRLAGPKPQGKTSGMAQVAKFCPFCGGNIQQSFRFCQYCGANLERYMSGSEDQMKNAEIEPRRVDFGLSHLGF